MIKQFLLVGLGGAVGSMLRFTCNYLIPNKNFPLATLLINIFGSFVIGVSLAYFLKNENFSNWKAFLVTGICGGFTTFSAFSYENFALLQSGKIYLSILYITCSVIFGIAATWFGFKLIS